MSDQSTPTAVEYISLTKGFFACVDAVDFVWLNGWRWHVRRTAGKCYAVRCVMVEGKKTALYMHRVVLGLDPKDPAEVDHRNGNGLDNRRENLRPCTHAQNQHNQGRRSGSSSFKGVFFRPKLKKKPWMAQLALGNQRMFLGYYASPEEAARAYDRAATEAFGEFCRLNFPPQRGPCP